MNRRPLIRTTPCLGWWFGGPHSWPRQGDRCEICHKTRPETQQPLEEVREMWRKLPEIRAAQLAETMKNAPRKGR